MQILKVTVSHSPMQNSKNELHLQLTTTVKSCFYMYAFLKYILYFYLNNIFNDGYVLVMEYFCSVVLVFLKALNTSLSTANNLSNGAVKII